MLPSKFPWCTLVADERGKSYVVQWQVTDLEGSDMTPGIADAGLPVTGQRSRQTAGGSWSGVLSQPAAYVFAWAVAVAVSLTGCAPAAETPMSQPVAAMEAAWGPFARQCDSTRVSRTGTRWRLGETEVADVYETCVGFSVMLPGQDSAEITASVGRTNQPSSSMVVRIMRKTSGVARAAVPGDTGLLAQGSDAGDAAELLARNIGLTAHQVVSPNDTLALPVRLSLPFPLDVVLSCRPDGGHRDHGRDTLVLSCTLDQQLRTEHLDAQLQLAGVEEIDVQTGVRLSSALSGRLSGRKRLGGDAAWQSANDRLLYRRETEFE